MPIAPPTSLVHGILKTAASWLGCCLHFTMTAGPVAQRSEASGPKSPSWEGQSLSWMLCTICGSSLYPRPWRNLLLIRPMSLFTNYLEPQRTQRTRPQCSPWEGLSEADQQYFATHNPAPLPPQSMWPSSGCLGLNLPLAIYCLQELGPGAQPFLGPFL